MPHYRALAEASSPPHPHHPTLTHLRPAQRHQHLHQLRQALFPRAAGGETVADVVDCEGDWAGRQQVGDGADLIDGPS